MRELVTLRGLDDAVEDQDVAVRGGFEDKDVLEQGLFRVQDLVDSEECESVADSRQAPGRETDCKVRAWPADIALSARDEWTRERVETDQATAPKSP